MYKIENCQKALLSLEMTGACPQLYRIKAWSSGIVKETDQNLGGEITICQATTKVQIHGDWMLSCLQHKVPGVQGLEFSDSEKEKGERCIRY